MPSFGAEFSVNVEFENAQEQQQVVVLNDGRVLVIWTSNDPDVDGSLSGISARVGTVQPDGSMSWGAAGEVTVNVYGDSWQDQPQVTVLADGRIVVTWRTDNDNVDTSQYGVATRVGSVQADGSIAWGTINEFRVNEEISSLQETPQLMQLADGRVLFTWSSYDGDVDGASAGIAGRIGEVQGDGTIVWEPAGEFTINEEVTGVQTTPQITQLADGRLLVVWESFDPDVDGLSSGVSARVGSVQNDGSISWASAGEFTVNVNAAGNQQAPQITLLTDGRVLFVWQTYGGAISARIGAVQNDGSMDWGEAGEFTLNTQDVDVSAQPQAIRLEDGRVLFTWTCNDSDLDGSADGVAGRIGEVQANGSIAWDGAEFLINGATTGWQSAPTMVELDDGRVLVTYTDTSTGGLIGRVMDLPSHDAANDFFGDGTSDILLRNSSGITAIWALSANGVVTFAAPTQWQAPADWEIQGVGDFNSDGRDDFLLRRTDGVTAVWTMDGVNVTAADVTLWQADNTWQIQDVGDFNGDGRDDILWRRDDGVTSIWQMDGTNVIAADVTLWQASNDWQIQGTGDFNGDGREDFLWRNSSGVTAVWMMDGAIVQSADVLSQQTGLEWTIAGIGDFDGDGRDDIVMQRDGDNLTAVFTMNGATVVNAAITSTQAGSEWSIAAVGDYNGDGRDDILIRRDADGLLAVWTMSGATVTSADVTNQQAGADWDVI